MSGYGCYHSLPARQRYTIDNEEWNTDAELKPFYALTPLETDAIAKLRLDVRSISNNIAVVALFDPDKHEYVREGDEVCYCVFLISILFIFITIVISRCVHSMLFLFFLSFEFLLCFFSLCSIISSINRPIVR